MLAVNSNNSFRIVFVSVIAILFLFILSLFYLRAVVWGLLLAALFLPLQRWCYNRFLNFFIINKINFYLFNFWTLLTLPARFFSPKKSSTLNEEFKRKQSCVLTVFFFSTITLLGLFFMTFFSTPYLKVAKEKLVNVLQEKKANDLVKRVAIYLENKPYYKSVQQGVQNIYSYFKTNILIRVKDFFVNGVEGTFNFLFEFFLTFFFFIFFLEKLSYFYTLSKNPSLGNYIVDSFFASSWTPKVNNDVLGNVKEIINNVISKLTIWLRGYTKIIIFETIYYFICFYFLDVPYALPLSMIAGLTILLPFLGPLLSLIITLGVCFAVIGGLPLTLFVSVLVVYMLMNLIIEQFLLYPRFIGNALGLTTIETIVVVLIGGIIANVLGMFLAVPIASVLKYLIPKIYKSLK